MGALSRLRLLRSRDKQNRAERDHYRQDGYHVFRGAFDRAKIEAIATLARGVADYEGKLLRQDGSLSINEFVPGTRLIRNSLANPHLPLNRDLAPLSAALGELLASQALVDRLRLLDDAKSYIIHQVLCFYTAQTTELHIDSWSVDTAPRGYSHTVWIPLQDVTYRSGVPAVLPWPQGKYLSEEDLGVSGDGSVAERYERYHRAFERKLLDDRPEICTAPLKKGDFFVWTSLTPHLTLPSMPHPQERLSLQVLIKPTHVRRGTFLDQPEAWFPERAMRVHDSIYFYIPGNVHTDFGIEGNAQTAPDA